MNQPQLGNFESIALAAIRPSPTNPRKYFDPLQLEELARSIGETGVIQPLLLRPWTPYFIEAEGTGYILKMHVLDVDGTDTVSRISFHGSRETAVDMMTATIESNESSRDLWGFEIVAGERRWRAAKIAGKEGVPAIVKELTDAEVLDLQLTENLQRTDLHPVEEAEGYQALIALGYNAVDIAKKTGKSVAHVSKTMKLLALSTEAKKLYGEGHITLEHALLLARLTVKEQTNALLYLLGARDWEHKGVPDEQRVLLQLRDRIYNAKHSGSDVISTNSGQLKSWIESHVLLKLAGASFGLDDAALVPEAGPCTTCPKRTGANPALFADITSAADTCTDPACFATKQSAQVKRELDESEAKGARLLKLSTKPSVEKLAAPVFEFKPGKLNVDLKGSAAKVTPTVKAVVTTKRAVKHGQWVESKKAECPATVQGVFSDGANKGKIRYVCPDQACKVHKHHVEQPKAKGPSATAPKGESSEDRNKRINAERERTQKLNKKIEDAIIAELERGDAKKARMLEKLVAHAITEWSPVTVVDLFKKLGIEIPAKVAKMNSWQQGEALNPLLEEWLGKTTNPELHDMALQVLLADALDQYDSSYTDKNNHLVMLAARLNVDAIAIAERITKEQAKIEAELKATSKLKPDAKKAVAKKSTKPSAAGIDGKSAAAGEGVEERTA